MRRHQFALCAFARQRSVDVVGDEGQQLLVTFNETDPRRIALHSDHADRGAVARQRYAEPAVRKRAETAYQTLFFERLDIRTVREQRHARFDHVLGETFRARAVTVRTGIRFVYGISEFDMPAIIAQKRNIEIFRVQQFTDDGMQVRVETLQTGSANR